MDSLNFVAEVKQVKSRKMASLDVVYSVTLETNNPDVLSLGTINGDQTVSVEISVDN